MWRYPNRRRAFTVPGQILNPTPQETQETPETAHVPAPIPTLTTAETDAPEALTQEKNTAAAVAAPAPAAANAIVAAAVATVSAPPAPAPNANVPLAALPSELIREIIDKVPQHIDKICLALTCKSFMDFIRSLRPALRLPNTVGGVRTLGKRTDWPQPQHIAWLEANFSLCSVCGEEKHTDLAVWKDYMSGMGWWDGAGVYQTASAQHHAAWKWQRWCL